MRSVLSIVTSAEETDLATLARVKAELVITVSTYNDILQQLIEDASSRIEAHLGFRLPYERVLQTFRPDRCGEARETLILERSPVDVIHAVAEDDTAVSASEYEFDEDAGLLYRLDSSGYRSNWSASRSITVNYSAGYRLPDDTDQTLPAAIEGACVAFVRALWFGRQRDPQVKAVDVPGVMSEQYWVGSVGEAGALPPDVEAMLKPFRRPE